MDKSIKQELPGYFRWLDDVRTGKEGGLKTGWKKFDNLFYGGIKRKKQILIGASTSIGKTTFMNNLILRICQNNPLDSFLIIYLNFEMSNYDQINKFICSMAQIEEKKIIEYNVKRTIDEESLIQSKYGLLDKFPITFIDEPITPKKIEERVKHHNELHPTKHIILVLDHIQLAESDKFGKKDRVSDISRSFALMKMKYDLTTIIASQLNRDPESPEREKDQFKPRRSDLKESGDIENDADIIILLHRPLGFEVGISKGWNNFLYGAKGSDGKGESTIDTMRTLIVKNRGGIMGDYISFNFKGASSYVNEKP